MSVRREVLAAVQELLTDPDAGLELSAYARRRLRLAKKSNGKRFTLAELRYRYS
ncbi:MAG: hypothetical protein AAB767_01925 [Patescibacteria group bacterium]